ncbi:MAG: MFS transporter [Deltaproteobacteria bacterium]|nr:MFS transporter [Deltaproteobacteria bacterium]
MPHSSSPSPVSEATHGTDGSAVPGGGSLTDHLSSLLLLTGIFFLNFVSRIVAAPLLPAIEGEMKIGHGQAASLFLFISLGYFVSIFLSGLVSSRINHRKTILLSSMTVGLALIGLVFTETLFAVRAGLLVLGLASGFYLPSGIATLTQMIDPRHWGRAIAIHETAPNLGFVAAPLVAELFLRWFSWRSVFGALGFLSVGAGLAFALFGKGGRFRGQAPAARALKDLLRVPGFWMIMTLFGVGITGTLGLFNVLPLYLVTDHGIDRGLANTWIASSRIGAIPMAFLGGWISDRLGPHKTMTGVLAITGTLTVMLGVVRGSWVITMVFLQPLVAVCFFPAAFAALSAVTTSGARNVAVSVTVPLAFLLGAGAIPAGIGYAGDAGFFGLGITLTGVLMLGGALLKKISSGPSHG